MRGDAKSLSTKESALANNFLLLSFFSESTWYVGVYWGWDLGRSTFNVVDFVVFSLLRKEAGTRRGQTVPYQDKWLNTIGVVVSTNWKPLSDVKRSRLCFHVVRFNESKCQSRLYLLSWCLFTLCKFPWSGFTMHSLRNRINSFGHDWRNWIFHLRENDWNAWRIERVCVLIVQSCQMLQTLRHVKCWGGCFHSLCSNVIYRLFAAINQWVNDQKYQSTREEPSPSWILSVFICITSLGDLNNAMCVVCSSISRPRVLLWNKLCLMYIVLSQRCLPAVAFLTNPLEMHTSSQESSKMRRYFVPLFFNESINSKFTSLTNSIQSISFWILSYSDW